MTGSLATLASTWMAAPMTATAPTTSSALVQETHSKFWPPSETQISRIETPPTSRKAPR